jgi:hypothetical protein
MHAAKKKQTKMPKPYEVLQRLISTGHPHHPECPMAETLTGKCECAIGDALRALQELES